MVWTTRNQAENEIISQLKNESDRAAAIIGATILEDRLTRALKSYMLYDEKLLNEIFQISGPLGNFIPKIKLSYLVGMFNKDTYMDMKTIAEIRNDFAHKLECKDFKTDTARDRAKNLKIPERYVSGEFNRFFKNLLQPHYSEAPDDSRERYLLTCQILVVALSRIARKKFSQEF